MEDPLPKPITQADIDNLFTYHEPKADQSMRSQAIQDAAKYLGQIILANTHQSADQMKAITKLREAVMMANASIALEPDDLAATSPLEFPDVKGIPALVHEWGDVVDGPDTPEFEAQAVERMKTMVLADLDPCVVIKVTRPKKGRCRVGVSIRAVPIENYPDQERQPPGPPDA